MALGLSFAISPSQAAQNALEAHLQVLDDEIATHEALLKEIERQAKERVTELHA